MKKIVFGLMAMLIVSACSVESVDNEVVGPTKISFSVNETQLAAFEAFNCLNFGVTLSDDNDVMMKTTEALTINLTTDGGAFYANGSTDETAVTTIALAANSSVGYSYFCTNAAGAFTLKATVDGKESFKEISQSVTANSILTGTWKTSCKATKEAKDETDTIYLISKIAFNGTAVVITEDEYGSTGCSGTPMVTKVQTATFVEEGLATGSTDTINVTNTTSSYSWNIKNQNYLDAVASGAVCGITDFELNTAKNILPSCTGSSSSAVEYSYFKYSTGLGAIYIGDEDWSTKDGETAANRLEGNNSDLYHTKQ